MKSKKISFYIKPRKDIYGETGYENILKAFSRLNPSTKEGELGAGASGLMPELDMFVKSVAPLIVAGFLGAIGGDIYDLIKKGIMKIVDVKPIRKSVVLPENFKGEIYSHLVFWIYFKDYRLLIELDLKSKDEVKRALDSLPAAVNKVIKNGKDFSRLIWNGSNWNAY
ncbi:MAG: hypothetical protein AAB521_02435 [Patescibacteria group bacterium]